MTALGLVAVVLTELALIAEAVRLAVLAYHERNRTA